MSPMSIDLLMTNNKAATRPRNVEAAGSDKGRLAGLRRFAIAITILTLLGHTVLGFEQSWIQPLIALVTAYSVEFLLELIDARLCAHQPRYVGNWRTRID